MAGRRLDPEEAALWARVRATVRPLVPFAVSAEPVRQAMPPVVRRALPAPPPVAIARKPALPKVITNRTLDGGWDKRIAVGGVSPDRTIDLHGHTLRSAHAALDVDLGHAIAAGDRVVLLVTGKPPRAESERPHARGAIRSAVLDWLAQSRHAGSIAAVRGAHPRHGGAGALYVVLRRRRMK